MVPVNYVTIHFNYVNYQMLYFYSDQVITYNQHLKYIKSLIAS